MPSTEITVVMLFTSWVFLADWVTQKRIDTFRRVWYYFTMYSEDYKWDFFRKNVAFVNHFPVL